MITIKHVQIVVAIAMFSLNILPNVWAATSRDSVVSKYNYRVVKVLDGDTLVASDGNVSFHVRIAGIDAPEKDQAYGKVSKLRLQELIGGETIQIIPVGKGYDKYSRVLGKVLLDDKEPAIILVEEGLATYYRPTCHDYPADKQKYEYDISPYLNAEFVARKLKKNMWSNPNGILPCKWRRLGE